MRQPAKIYKYPEMKFVGEAISLSIQFFEGCQSALILSDGRIIIADNNKHLSYLLDKYCPIPSLHIYEGLLCPVCSEQFISVRLKHIEKTDCPACGHKF